jgi:hypothetical protein
MYIEGVRYGGGGVWTERKMTIHSTLTTAKFDCTILAETYCISSTVCVFKHKLFKKRDVRMYINSLNYGEQKYYTVQNYSLYLSLSLSKNMVHSR